MKNFACLILMGCSTMFHTMPASAAILEIDPASTSVTTGQILDVEISIAGLVPTGPPSVGAFDLDVSFDPNILQPTRVEFGPFLGDQSLFDAIADFSFLPGVVDLAEVSLLSPGDLDILQPSSFLLATISFDAQSNGTTDIVFTQTRVDDAFGNKLPIPEPSTFLLLILALVPLTLITMLHPRARSVMFFGILTIFFGNFATPNAIAETLFSDDFEDGVIDTSVYVPIGSAILSESGGKLRVMIFAEGDGVQIRAPDGATCFEMTQEISPNEFEVRDATVFTTNFLDPDTDDRFPGFEMTLLRPFWNFCEYEIKQGDVTEPLRIFCGRGYTSKKDCPSEKKIRLDWLPPKTEGGKDRFVYEILKPDGTLAISKKPRESTLKHNDNKIVDYTITFKKINPEFTRKCPAPTGSQSQQIVQTPVVIPDLTEAVNIGPALNGLVTIELDDVTISDEHTPDVLACDFDVDQDVDRDDISALFAARNTTVAPNDPRDVDADGIITVNDARICVLKCTSPRCTPPLDTNDIIESTSPIDMTPDVIMAGSTVTNVRLEAEEPLFVTPDLVISFGAGVLLERLRIVSPFTALADLKVSTRAPLGGRGLVAESPSLTRMDFFDIDGLDVPRDNTNPTIALIYPLQVLPQQAVEVLVEFDDIDDDFTEVLLAVENAATEEVVFRSDRLVVDTGSLDPLPEQLRVTVPGLPSGSYLLVGVIDDGNGPFVVTKQPLAVTQ